jgi:ParB/RepB/Spo0J family partition protein
MSERKVIEVNLKKLGIDKCNIRQGSWNYDQEMINSVKTRGVVEPLLVRPLDVHPEGKEYGIVCGSRRYHAALAAGLDKVLCVVEGMDDLKALSTSMIENRQRSDTPTWLDIESVGRIYSTLQNHSHQEKIEYIHNKTGMSHQTINKYLDIFSLPDEVKGLIRESNERTTKQSEILLLYQPRATSRTLYIGNAECLAELRDLDNEKLMEIAVFLMDKSVEVAKKLVEFVKIDPDTPITEIYDKMIRKVYGIHEKTIRFDNETWDAVMKACMDRQIRYEKYLMKIIRDRLNRDGYLGAQDAIESEMTEEEKDYFEIKGSKNLLSECGYKYLKNDGEIRIFQKPTKSGKGGFFKAFSKGQTIWVRLTPGDYQGEDTKILNDEKKRLLEYKEEK